MRLGLVTTFALLAAGVWAQQKPEAVDLPFVPGKRWAIVVGAAGYEHLGKLRYPDDDANAVAKTLIENYRFEPDSVKLLTDSPDCPLKPTAGNILGEVEDALANKALSKSDLFVFFFAGHGVGTERGDYLMPTDARLSTVERVGLPVSEVIGRFVKAGMKNVLIICDACRSGKVNPFGAELQKLGKEANIAVMLGCAPGARSYEAPEFKHGAFAYHLLKALKDPTLRDPVSGALWASAIGDFTRKKTKSYTQVDYGADAQVPYIWGNRADDVLLGAFVPSGGGANLVSAFNAKAKELTPKYYASAMAEFGEQLFLADRYPETVEVMRTLEQLGQLEPASRYLLAVTLAAMDRTGESDQEYKKLVAGEDGFFRNLALATNSTRTSTPDKKLAAALELWKSDKSWTTGYLTWSALKEYGSTHQQTEMLREFLAMGASLTKRRSEYIKGELAYLESRWADALAAFNTAEKSPGDAPESNTLALLQVPLYVQLEKFSELDKFVAEHAKSSPKAVWKLIKANRLKALGKREESVEWLKQAVAADPTPDELLLALKSAGMYFAAILDEVTKQAEKHPYSWKALLAKSMTVGMKDGVPGLMAAVAEAEKHAEDIVSFRCASMEVFDSFLEELFDAGKLDGQQYVQFIDATCSQLIDEQDSLGQDLSAWWDLVMFAEKSERTLQVSRIIERQLGAAIRGGTVSPRLAVTLMIGTLSAGNEELGEKLYKIAIANGDPTHDASRMYAVYLASRGKYAEAEKAFVNVMDEEPELRTSFTIFKAWLDAGLGRKKDALAKLAANKPGMPYADAMAGLAHAELGDMDSAVPLLMKSRTDRSWGYMYLHGRALEVLAKHLQSKGDKETVDLLAFEASTSQYGNSLFAFPGYSEGKYQGETKLDVRGLNEDYEPVSGKLEMKVGADGILDGTFEAEGGHIYKISGKADSNGNVTGTVKGEGKEESLFAKIAPPGHYGTFPKFAEVGQVFMLLDAKNRRTLWIGKPLPK